MPDARHKIDRDKLPGRLRKMADGPADFIAVLLNQSADAIEELLEKQEVRSKGEGRGMTLGCEWKGLAPGGPHIATEFDCQPTRARGVLSYIGRLLWDRPPWVLLSDPDGPWLWRFDHQAGRYKITNRKTRREVSDA